MPLPPRTRQACDRCHSQKLRCSKLTASAVCARCMKAAVPCVYTPAGPVSASLSSASSNPSNFPLPAPSLVNGASSLDWDSFSFGLLLKSQDLQEPQGAHQAFPNHSPSTPFDARAQCFDRLSAIMAQLNEALRHLPPVSKLHIAGPEVKRLCSVISTSYSLRQSLETMLAQAQQLVEIYPDTISLAVTHDDVAQCTLTNCIHTYKPHPDLGQDPFELAAHRSAPLDFLLLNQLVSCHYRLYDITELFLFHIHLCFKLSISSNPGEVHQFEIPQLRIGSFTPSPRFSPSIITTVLIDQQSSLASFLASLQIALHGTSGRESQVLTMECDMLKDRAESIAGRLVKFRDASNKSGLVS